MTKRLLSALVATVLVSAWGVALAKEAPRTGEKDAPAVKPVVVVSFAGYDRAIKVLETIDKSGKGSLASRAESELRQRLQVQDLDGIDRKRPWGLLVQTDGQDFPIVAFLPVTDLKKLLASLEPQIGKVKDNGKGIYEIPVESQIFYLTQKAGWAWVAGNPDHLDTIPKDPLKALDGLNTSYDLAVRITISNIPKLMRPMLMAPLQMGLQMGAGRMKNESDQAFALRSKYLNMMTQQMMATLNDLDAILLGAKVDHKASTAVIDYQVTALEGTKTARQIAGTKGLKSDFAAFFSPDAATSLVAAGKLSDADVTEAKRMLSGYRTAVSKGLDDYDMPEAEIKEAKQILGDLFDVLEKTVETRRSDYGLSVLAGSDRLTLVGGCSLAETGKLDSVLKRLVPYIRKENPDVGNAIKLDAETHQGVKLHTFSWPTSELQEAGERLLPLLGENLDVAVGIGPQAAYLAAGRNAVATLKQFLDKSKSAGSQEVPPLRLSVAVTPILKAVAAAAARDQVKQVAQQAIAALAQSQGQDHVTVTGTMIPNGVKVQVVIEPGILRLIGSGKAAKAAE